jgi:DNA (cytosine-5)-methyltransferase 1
MLWASPECTNHSLSKGKARKNITQRTLWGNDNVDPDEERSRATMREVVEFSEFHQYDLVIVENVTEIRYWAYYQDWLSAMHNLGYAHREVFLNSMHAGVPQSRDRIYVCFWKRGNRKPDLDIRPLAPCPHCGQDVETVWVKKNPKKVLPGRVMYGKQYVYVCPRCARQVEPYYHPAATVIDWSRHAAKISERKRELSPNTLRRIRKGLGKYGGRYMLIDTLHTAEVSDASHTRTMDRPLPTQTTSHSLGLVMPFVVDLKQGVVDSPSCIRPVDGVMATMTTRNTFALVQPEPFIVSQYGRDSAHSPTGDPMPAITGFNNQHALLVPPAFLAAYYGGSDVFTGADESMSAITGKVRHALVEFDPANIEIGECRYRMLQTEELKLGMSFPQEYLILGTSDEVKTKQIGNAVTPNVATLLGQRMFASLS